MRVGDGDEGQGSSGKPKETERPHCDFTEAKLLVAKKSGNPVTVAEAKVAVVEDSECTAGEHEGEAGES